MEEECTEFIFLQDQANLLETLVKNLSILRHEAPQLSLIDAELELLLQSFKEISTNLAIKLQGLNQLAERMEEEQKKQIVEFVEDIQESWKRTAKEITEEHSGLTVASRSALGLTLTSILAEIRRTTASIQVSLQIGEMIYDSDFLIQGFLYCNEIFKLLGEMDGCDKRIRQYLVTPKVTCHLQVLDSRVDEFSQTNTLLPTKDEQLQVFSKVSSLLSGELFGWKPENPSVILQQNHFKKPVFITKHTKRTQVKRLANLPLFHSVQKNKSND